MEASTTRVSGGGGGEGAVNRGLGILEMGGSDSNGLVLEHGEQRRQEKPSSPSQPRGNHISKVLYTVILYSKSTGMQIFENFCQILDGAEPAGSKPPAIFWGFFLSPLLFFVRSCMWRKRGQRGLQAARGLH
jgi:hypothetical protein